MSRSKTELIKSIFENERSSAKWSPEAKGLFRVGSTLLDESKQSQQKIAEILIGTLIAVIALDENPHRPLFELPGHELNGSPYYPLNKKEIFTLCEFNLIENSFKDDPKASSVQNYVTRQINSHRELILRIGDKIIKSELPFEPKQLKLRFSDLISNIDEIEYLRDNYTLQVTAELERVTGIVLEVTGDIFDYNAEHSSKKAIRPLNDVHKVAEISKSNVFAFKALCQLGTVSSLALVSGVVAEFFDFRGAGQSLKAMGAVGLMETGYGLFKSTSSSSEKTKESEPNIGDASGMTPD